MKIKRFSNLIILCMIVSMVLSGCDLGYSKKTNNKNNQGNTKADAEAIYGSNGNEGSEVMENKNDKKNAEENSNKNADKIEVIVAGESKVYLDEVKYYAYNTQATYEAYYIAENMELDWNKEMSVGVPLETAVKLTVLERISEREAIVSFAGEYGVELSEEEIKAVDEKVKKFFEGTNKGLLEKISIKEKRLKSVYEKDALFEKVKAVMETEKEGKSEATYKKWKTVNNVTTNGYWDEINYQEPIFMK